MLVLGEPPSILNICDVQNTTPIVGSCEHDLLSLCGPQPSSGDAPFPELPPASTGVVDAAIRLFSVLLPVQDASSASRAITHVIQALNSPKLERNVGRKSAGFINSVVAILLSLRNVTNKQQRDVLGGPQISGLLANFLKVSFLVNIHTDSRVTLPLRTQSMTVTTFFAGLVRKQWDV